MQKRHQTPDLYFREQSHTTRHHVIPFIRDILPITNEVRVLEIGCGHGGNMEPFLDLGCTITGLDVNPNDVRMAEEFLANHRNRGNLTLLTTDVYFATPEKLGTFDLVIMKDVIEHIHDQEKFMKFIRRFLSRDGRMFLGFPPWQMPFGGHQQVCESRVLSVLPYYHLLPARLYGEILRLFGEKPARVEELLETRKTGISIERFRRVVSDAQLRIEKESLYLINPNYEIKFGLKPRLQIAPVASLPGIRNFLTTCCYYLVRKS